MMTKKNTQILATTLLVIGAYLIYKKMFAKKTTKSKIGTTDDTGIGTGIGTGSGTTKSDIPSGYVKYVVNTASGNLNVRSKPSTTEPPIDKYPKGKEFIAPYFSQPKGWVEVWKYVNGKFQRIGYVSAQFVKPKP